jgi:hypothetical protein
MSKPKIHEKYIDFSGLSDSLNVSILSDVHIDSSLCNYDRLKRIMAERNSLPNHRVLVIGDACDLVLPGDLKRFKPSVRPQDIATRDDFLMASIERAIELFKGLNVQFDLIGRGNHEDEIEKRFGIDVTEFLARALGCANGGYSGFFRYFIKLEPNYYGVPFIIAYHHGAWGGKYAKGYIGAREWFDHLWGWDVAVFGHNHASRVDTELRTEICKKAGKTVVRDRKVYLVNCSSFVDPNLSDGVHYTERRGYPRQPSVPPLIQVRVRRTRWGGGRELGLDVQVTV